jgi:membrane protein DedA with SNARE-associated domain
MNLQDTLLATLTSYGPIVLFVAVLVASIGVPLPVSFLLIAAGAFVEQGDMNYLAVVASSVGGAVIGDHIGYSIGLFGGRSLAERISRRFKAEALLGKAESTMHKWGDVSVFLSRWLITALGPYINLTSGITRHKLPHFTLFDLLGEILWVLAYVQLGRFFSDRVAEVTDAMGELVWVVLGAIALVFLGVKMVQAFCVREADSR